MRDEAMRRSISPPPARLLLGEVRGAFEPARLLLRAPLLATLPRGNGARVVLLPGYGAAGSSTAMLRGFLRLLGYRSHDWGLGRNTGNVAKLVPVTAIFSKSDGIVAWEACIDRRSPGIEHVEVATTHIGLGFSPEVYRLIADRLVRHATPPARGRAA